MAVSEPAPTSNTTTNGSSDPPVKDDSPKAKAPQADAYGSNVLEDLAEDESHVFNMDSGVLPAIHSKLELRDLDFIWCVATVIKVMAVKKR